MPLAFDATVKDLAQASPRGLLETFDAPTTMPVALLNIDLSTVTSAADVVFGLGEPLQEIVHLDFQTSASATKHRDIAAYNTLLHRQHQVPVHSIVVLLRPQASHPNLHGTLAYAPRPGRGRMAFEYEVIRLWERPASELLAGDLGATPLAMLGQFPPDVDVRAGLAEVAQRLIERLDHEAPVDKSRRLATAAYILTGLRVPRQEAFELFKGVRTMRDSDTYMAIVDEGIEKGRREEVKKLLVRLGRKTLGDPDKRTSAALEAITDIDRLEALAERLGEVKTWRQLLAK